MFISLFTIILAVLVTNNEAANILAIFPVPSISHQVVFRPLTQELAKRGHKLVILTTDPAFPKGQAPPNITEIDVHDKSYDTWRREFLKYVDGKRDSFELMRIAFKVNREVFEMQLRTTEFQKVIRENTFDLVLVESCVRSAIVMSHVVKAPMIQVSSLGAVVPNYDYIGAPRHPVLYPEFTVQRIYNLSLIEKLYSIREYMLWQHMMWDLEDADNAMIKKVFGENTPTIDILKHRVDMLFLNIHPIWEGNRPVPPSVVYMGGLHIKPQPHKELPKELKSYLGSAEHGVIYISFGTNVNPSLLPPEKINIFLKVFSKLPYKVLLKWDKDVLQGKPKNVKIFKWMPQSDLLRHPKIKLFITQGGLQSTDEAIQAGVPLIAFPMISDQWYNAEKFVHHGIGLKMDINTLSEPALEEAISKIVNDGSFRHNIAHLSLLMRDQPMSGLERAVWWTEHVLRHGGARHLRSEAADATWSEFFMLDVILVLLTAAIILTIILSIGLRILFHLVCGSSRKLKKH